MQKFGSCLVKSVSIRQRHHVFLAVASCCFRSPWDFLGYRPAIERAMERSSNKLKVRPSYHDHFQMILAGTLTGVQSDIRCKVLGALSTVK